MCPWEQLQQSLLWGIQQKIKMWERETGGSSMKGSLIQALKLTASTAPVNFFWIFGNSRCDSATFVCWVKAPSCLCVMLYNLRSWWCFAVCSVSICYLVSVLLGCYILNKFSYLKMKAWILWFTLQTIANMTTGESFSSIEIKPYVQLPNNLVP